MPKVTSPFTITPSDLPNKGLLFVDHEARGRSGHGGGTLIQAQNGDILAFYSNVDGDAHHGGHSVSGWTEYKRSSDNGNTWSDPIPFEYSLKSWNGDEVHSSLVFTVNKTGNGNLVAVLVRFANGGWEKKLPPVYLVSSDHGQSWDGPFELDPDATVEALSITYDGSFFCRDTDTLYIVCIGGVESMCPGPYSLYATKNNGASFERISTLPFPHTFMYGTGSILPDGSIIVYSYPYTEGKVDEHRSTEAAETDEHNMHYVISKDGGKTWSDPQKSYFTKRLRNGQMTARIGGLYFMHGRSGHYGEDPRNLVLYTSEDGLNWDEGTLLKKLTSTASDSYSANTIVTDGKMEKLLLQSSIAYDGIFRVNIHHWWITIKHPD